MPFLYHHNDWTGVPPKAGGEDAFMDTLRNSGIKPGNYLFPAFHTREAM